jgi:hypothetical protein
LFELKNLTYMNFSTAALFFLLVYIDCVKQFPCDTYIHEYNEL